ncbi:putative methyltransferase-domain-containing protein [Helicostylum pulchrum]|nr:putative methyltransferase-domain-containing protein [Helicostylum pulchrum]
MNSIKKISFQDQEGSTEIHVEEVLDAAYGCYIWPSALVMAEFLWYHRHQFIQKTILEVGAGTSIPSLVLAKSCSPSHLILTDMPQILPVIRSCLQRNNIQDAWVQSLLWGQFGSETSIDYLTDKVESQLQTKIDYILGSDTFYEPAQFENLLVLVSYVIHHHNSKCRLFTAYQERSPKRSIQYLLDKWKLQCRHISKDSFEFDELKYIDREEGLSEVIVSAGTLSSVFLLEISAA